MKARRVGADLSPKDLVPGMTLVQTRKGTAYLIVKVTREKILAKFRRGMTGRFSKKLYDVVPSELIGYTIIDAN